MRPRRMWPVTAPAFVIGALLFLFGVGASWYFHACQRDTSEELSEHLGQVLGAERLLLAVRDMRVAAFRYIFDRDRTEFEKLPERIDDICRMIEGFIAGDHGELTPPEIAVLMNLRHLVTSFNQELGRILKNTDSSELVQALTVFRGGSTSLSLVSVASEFLDINHQQVREVNSRNVWVSNRMAIGLLLLGICGGVGGVLGGYGMSRTINRNLIQLSVPIRSVAGKLDEVVGPLTFSAGHSFEEITDVLEQMAGRVGQVVEHLHESRQQALRSEQLAAVGQLAAGMAHELRNPLTSVKILVQSAAERPVPGLRSPRDLAVLEEEIGRMEQLITTFLDFARPPAPKKRLIDLRSDVEHVLEVVRARAERIGAHLDATLPTRPVMLLADAMQIRQLVMNLTLNALDACGPGGNVWLSIDDEDVEPPSGGNERPGVPWLSLRVSDDGPGLPAELGAKIFDPFVSTKETGIGLGLSICKRIAESHDGDIEAIDRPGGGAIFIVRLPMQSGPADLAKAPLATDSLQGG